MRSMKNDEIAASWDRAMASTTESKKPYEMQRKHLESMEIYEIATI